MKVLIAVEISKHLQGYSRDSWHLSCCH